MRWRLGDDTIPVGQAVTSAPPSLFQQLATGFAQYKLAQQQLDTSKQITALQLQRAQAGLPPLQIDPNTMGVPSVSVGLSSDTQALIRYGLIGVGIAFAANILSHRYTRRR